MVCAWFHGHSARSLSITSNARSNAFNFFSLLIISCKITKIFEYAHSVSYSASVLRVQNTVFLTRNRKNQHYRVKNHPFPHPKRTDHGNGYRTRNLNILSKALSLPPQTY